MRNPLNGLTSALRGENGTLRSFLFHALYRRPEDADQNLVFPHQPVFVADLKKLIEHHLEIGFRFVSPDDILAGLPAKGNYALMTFDDGYLNNINALPLLKEYRIPAVFFVTASNVKENKAFWWDTIWRERKRAGTAEADIRREISSMEQRTGAQIDAYLSQQFGGRSFSPIGDLDRPVTPSELKGFSREEFVHIGNHCMDHAVLTNYSHEGIEEQVMAAQKELASICKNAPTAISYPHGQFSNEVIEVAKGCGLSLGFTVKKSFEPLPLKDLMRIGRTAPKTFGS